MKKRFFLENFVNRSTCMHCDTREKAKEFLTFLDKNGRIWNDKTRYQKTLWNTYKEKTVYYFNTGMYGNLSFANMCNDTVLEFDDFIFNTKDNCKFMEKYNDEKSI